MSVEMPTYEYACKSCGEHLEVVQSFRDEALTECPTCGGALRKVFGSIGISFKGSGFYKTDSRSTTAASSSSSEAKGESKSETKSETKGDTKSETKSGSTTKSDPTSTSSASTPAAS
ncbi:MAG TPA: FmdB family zinc ribbon protein [Acidimicrobiales bacterium]|nr:FmdB family zinc ribbon protein [Acidimicrobiales bacterium]